MPSKAPTAEEAEPIVLPPRDIRVVEIPIRGTAPYISNKWSEKAAQMMRDKQAGKARPKKAPKIPQEDFESSIHRLEGGKAGIPSTAFKAAIVEGAREFDGLTMVAMKRALFVLGEGGEQLVPISGEAEMREDFVRNATGVADIRYRAQFWPWEAVLTVRFNARFITLGALIELVDAGGDSGVGDWRPSSKKATNGMFGTFEVLRGEVK